jgi:flagellin
MGFSIQTNVSSLQAQENLRINQNFQARTIARLTSGYRINSSGDDAAGLSVANQFRSSVAELTQGVRNANDGISQLQVIDGGLSNISKILDRLKTLATQSSSTTFSGDRGTLNTEFQSMLGEIDRQANNIKLNTGGDFVTKMGVYIGGSTSTNAKSSDALVGVDLSAGAVDSSALGISASSVLGGGVSFTGNTSRLDNAAATFSAQTFSVNYIDANGVAKSKNVSTGAVATGSQVISQLNTGLDGTGITAQTGSDGKLQFVGSGQFTIDVVSTAAGSPVSDGTTNTLSIQNTANFNVSSDKAFAAFTGDGSGADTSNIEQLTFVDGSSNKNTVITLSAQNIGGAGTISDTVTYLNTQLKAAGLNITALATDNNTHISFQGASAFTVAETGFTALTGAGTGVLFGDNTGAPRGALAAPTQNVLQSATGAALAAVDSISAAVLKLGVVQGKVGTGQNQLSYAISLAQSQISNFSSSEASIRDADVAAEAANLTKAQVLQQASMAAMAQANSAPQAILTLLKG